MAKTEGYESSTKSADQLKPPPQGPAPGGKEAIARVAIRRATGKEVAKVVVGPEAMMPTRAYEGDAGFDLYYSGKRPLQICPNGVAHVPSRVAIQWPPGVWGFIIGRSSAFQRGLLVNPTIIDAGFRGDLFAYVRNATTAWIEVQPNERIAQVVPLPLLAEQIQLIQVGQLDESDRGTNGFGSSGR